METRIVNLNVRSTAAGDNRRQLPLWSKSLLLSLVVTKLLM